MASYPLILATICVAALLAGVHGDSMPKALDLSQFKGQKVLFIVAHPDDIESLAGGLVYQLTQSGVEVGYLIYTNGDKGGSCYNATSYYDCTKEELAFTRQKEQIAAAAYLGVKAQNIRFLDLEDGMLPTYDMSSLQIKVTAHIRAFRPFAVFTWFTQPQFDCPPLNVKCPYCWGDVGYHPDHQMSGRVALDVVLGFAASLDKNYDELAAAGVLPWDVSQFYMFGLQQGLTHYVELSSSLLETKVNSIALHKSQVDNRTSLALNVQWIAQQVGKSSGVSMAEAFTAFF